MADRPTADEEMQAIVRLGIAPDVLTRERWWSNEVKAADARNAALQGEVVELKRQIERLTAERDALAARLAALLPLARAAVAINELALPVVRGLEEAVIALSPDLREKLETGDG